MSRRITGRTVEAVRERLGERDWLVLKDVARVRVLSTSQVERLHFVGGSSLSNARQCRKALARLSDWCCLTRLDRRVGGVRAGSASYLYTLGVVGQRLLTERGPAGGRRLRYPWEPSWPYVAHLLEVSELYVRLRETERVEPGLELLGYQAEPACWRRFWGASGSQVIKPDAFVRLGREEYEDRFFVEVDRGTESPRTLECQVRVYCQYWASGQEQVRSGVFPRVLWLVPDERRKALLVEVLASLPAESWQLFQVATADRAVEAITGSGSDSGAKEGDHQNVADERKEREG
ncbi:MAG: replication-relaxation family protein [Actinomycetota bacterium]